MAEPIDMDEAKKKLAESAERKRIKREAYEAEIAAKAWKANLQRTQTGYKGNYANYAIALEECPAFAGKFWYNARTHEVIASEETPAGPAGLWTDDHMTRLCRWLDQEYITAKRETIEQCVVSAARRRSSDPARDELDAFGDAADGQDWIRGLLTIGLRAENTDINYEMLKRWLIGFVARVFQPGCQMDLVLTLEGEQGIGKSSFCRTLAGEWCVQGLGDIHAKEAEMTAARATLIEIADHVAGSRYRDNERKAFYTKTEGLIRLPWGRTMTTVKRSCSLAITINPGNNGYLTDETGNRRYLPLACCHQGGKMDRAWIAHNRDQFLGQAVKLYRSGEPWHFTNPVYEVQLEQIQADRLEEDPLRLAILSFVSNLVANLVTTEEIAKGALKMDTDRIDRHVETRIGQVMISAGYRKTRISINGVRVRAYLLHNNEIGQPGQPSN